MTVGDFEDRVHIRGLTIEMDGNDRSSPWRDCRLQESRIHRVGDRIDIDKHGTRANGGDSLGGCDKGVRDRDDLIAWLDIERKKREMQRCGSIGESHAVLGADISGKSLLELLYLRSEHKGRAPENAGEDLDQLGLESAMHR